MSAGFGESSVRELLLKTGDIVSLDEGYTLTLLQVITEEIAENPDDLENYPAGSALQVDLQVNVQQQITLFSLLIATEPYTSKHFFDWKAYRFELHPDSTALTDAVKILVTNLENIETPSL
jgi:hypothetical protein